MAILRDFTLQKNALFGLVIQWPLLKVPSQVSGGLQNAIGWAKEAASSPAGESWSKDPLWHVPTRRAQLRYLLNNGCFWPHISLVKVSTSQDFSIQEFWVHYCFQNLSRMRWYNVTSLYYTPAIFLSKINQHMLYLTLSKLIMRK